MIAPRVDMTATLTPFGTVIIAGGDRTNASTGLQSTELYSVSTDTFSSSPVPMSVGRLSPTSTLLNTGEVLIAGGFVNNTSGTTNTTDLYTP